MARKKGSKSTGGGGGGNATSTSAAAKAAKKAKTQMKVERKEKKKLLKERDTNAGKSQGNNASGKGKGKSKGKKDEDSDDDLEGILEKMRQEWETAHKVTEELVEGPPSRRANATLTVCPNGNHLWCVGGEWFSEDGKAHFYNDVFRYSPEKDEWRKFVTPTCPGPRSAHAVAATPAGGGKLFLFGGEFSSLHQNSFHHYGDFWSFDVTNHMWDRIETRIRPSARSGHRMAVWKHFIVMFGGFYDPGVITRYLNDLWVFDTQEYTWKQVEFRDVDVKPSPRSGFSFLPCPEGIILHGGYCKQYSKGKRPVGMMLEDTWLLKLSIPDTPAPTSTSTTKSKSTTTPWKKGPAQSPLNLTAKWERRKRPSDAFAPSLRSGCTMALWPARSTGVLFGGVTDEDTSEEGMESVFWRDLYGYQISGKGRWVSLGLKQPKAKGGKKKGKSGPQVVKGEKDGGESDDSWAGGGAVGQKAGHKKGGDDKVEDLKRLEDAKKQEEIAKQEGEDDPAATIPHQRYNAMLAVLRNTLYIYGGIFEKGSKEYTLDDFHSLQLDKLDRYHCLRKMSMEIPEEVGSSSGSDDEDEDDDDDDDSDDSGDEEDEDSDYEGDEGYGEDREGSDADHNGEQSDGEGVGFQGGDQDGTDGGDEDEDDNKKATAATRNLKAKSENLASPTTKIGTKLELQGEDSPNPKAKRKSKKSKKADEEVVGDEGEAEIALEAVGDENKVGGGDESKVVDDELRKKAASFMQVSKDTSRPEEEVLSTPLPGETLALFFARSREYWSRKAAQQDTGGDNRGKELRRIGFSLAEERYESYKPFLQEVEKILAEAGLNEEEMRMSAQGAGQSGAGGAGAQSRNRR